MPAASTQIRPFKTIRIIKASGPDRTSLLPARIEELEAAGFTVLFDDIQFDPSWPYCAGSVADRSKAFTNALLEEASDAIFWARGGYGASDILPFIPWETVRSAKPKPIIGISDAVAAQAALYTVAGRSSLHGPMPANQTWRQNGEDDIHSLFAYLRGELLQSTFAVDGPSQAVSGKLFGGCFSVLTSLIGTPYLPKSLAGHILLFEDIDENPGRVMRMFNQWLQAGLLGGVQAIVCGNFVRLGGDLPDNAPLLFKELRRRLPVPVFTTTAFGHVSPNYPFELGAAAAIRNGLLTWKRTLSENAMS